MKEDYIVRKVEEFFNKQLSTKLKWRTKRTYLAAIQWFLTSFLNCKKAKYIIRR